MPSPENSVVLHASAVAVGGRGVLVTGASGTGKSALALGLISRGARLVADDQVRLTRRGDQIFLGAPKPGQPLIEARAVGVLDLSGHDGHAAEAPATDPTAALIVDLDQAPEGRLPRSAHRDLLGLRVPLISGHGVPNLASAIDAILRGAVLLDPDEPI